MFKKMDSDNDDHSTISEFQTSTESILSYEIQRTNPWSITSTEQVLEPEEEIIDGLYVLYGMGGILIFFIVYTICYTCFMHFKEKAELKRTELARLTERLARIAAAEYPQLSNGRVVIEEVNETSPNYFQRTKAKAVNAANQTSENTQTGQGNAIFEPRPSTSTLPQSETCFTEDSQDCPNSIQLQEYGTSRSVYQSDETDAEITDIGWMSVQPLCYSSPKESGEYLFSQDNLANVVENDAQTEKHEIDNLLEKDSNVTQSKKDGRRSPVHQGRSRSSPTSPDIVRRRPAFTDSTLRRPSSWL